MQAGVCCITSVAFFDVSFVQISRAHLDAVLKDVSREGETFLLINRFTEDHQLLKQKDPSFFRPRHETAVLLSDSEGVLLE